jgi:hypothetical protein
MPDEQRAGAKLNVFISYSRRDALDFADQLAKALEILEFLPILDREGISGGEAWKDRLGQLILECDTVVFVMTPESAESPICAWEVEEAQRLAKRILPVVAMPLARKTPPESLQRLNFIHFYPEPSVPGSGFGDGLGRLNIALKSDLAWLRQHRDLLVRAEAWVTADRDPDRLLRGGPLAEAERWRASRPLTAPDITGAQRAYLEASRVAEDESATVLRRQLEERERLLKEAELALQHRDAAMRQSLQNHSLFLAALARHAYQRGDSITATSLALEALPNTGPLNNERAVSPVEAVLFASMAAVYARWVGKEQEIIPAGRITVFFSADGGRIAAIQNDRSVHVTDAATGVKIAALYEDDYVTAGAFSRDGIRIATASGDNTARLWDGRSGAEIARLKGHTDAVLSVAFSPDGVLLLTTSWDQTARVWDSSTGKELAILMGHDGAVVGGAFSPDGHSIVTASRDKTARIWTDTGFMKHTLPNDDFVIAAAFSLDGERVATATPRAVHIWAAATGKELYGLVPPQLTRPDPGPRMEAVEAIEAVTDSDDGSRRRLWLGAFGLVALLLATGSAIVLMLLHR